MRSLPSRILALGAVLSIGAVSVAAQPPAGGTPRASRAAQEQRAARNPAAGLLRGITLTDAQQTRVRELRQRFVEQRQQLMGDRPGRRPQAGRQARQRPDSATRAAWRAEREATRGRMQQLAERQAADLRAVLTPAQQSTFDRNLTAMRQRPATRGRGRGERGVRRGAER
jgi:Spy/CpxP family protein refolding chaperone